MLPVTSALPDTVIVPSHRNAFCLIAPSDVQGLAAVGLVEEGEAHTENLGITAAPGCFRSLGGAPQLTNAHRARRHYYGTTIRMTRMLFERVLMPVPWNATCDERFINTREVNSVSRVELLIG